MQNEFAGDINNLKKETKKLLDRINDKSLTTEQLQGAKKAWAITLLNMQYSEDSTRAAIEECEVKALITIVTRALPIDI